MIDIRQAKHEPLVTLLVTCGGFPEHLGDALDSAVRQNYDNLEILVVGAGPGAGDGEVGREVREVAESFGDPRIVCVQPGPDRPVAAALNDALRLAGGEYVGYLCENDLHYPDHVAALVAAMEGSGSGAAYSNRYRTLFEVLPNGGRRALGKHLDVRRGFDRIATFYFSPVPRGAIMHRRDLLDRAGRFDEEAGTLIDWDIARRLAFYTDWTHVDRITGETCRRVDDSDGAGGERGDGDTETLLRSRKRILAVRPPKPWSMVEDLSIIYVCDRPDDGVAEALRCLAEATFYPHEFYLPTASEDASQPGAWEIPNLIGVGVPAGMPADAKVDVALRRCPGELIAVVPHGATLPDGWIESAVCSLLDTGHPNKCFIPKTPGCGAPVLPTVVLRKEELLRARKRNPALPLRHCLAADSIVAQAVERSDLSFRLGGLLEFASRGRCDDVTRTAALCEDVRRLARGDLRTKEELAQSLLRTDAPLDRVLGLYEETNQSMPTVGTLFAEAKLRRRADQPDQAVALLQRAREILQWKGAP